MNQLQIRNTLTSTFSKDWRSNRRKKEKKQIVLNGSLLRPLSVGRGAILHAGGNIYHTSRVVTILEESEDCVRFETQNSHYYLSMSPFPLAAVSPLPVRLAACA